jgi:hypothetical protein
MAKNTNQEQQVTVRTHFMDAEKERIKYVSVKEFVKIIKNRASEDARRVYIEGTLAVKDYERYEVVCAICDQIIANSYFTTDGQFKVDSCKKYLLYVSALLNTYTNIKFDENDILGDFNLLQRYGLIDVIINYIPEAQVAMFDSVLNMKSNDIMTNYYEPHAFVKEQLVKFAPLIHGWIESFLGAAEEMIKDIDVNKIKGLITDEKYNKT